MKEQNIYQSIEDSPFELINTINIQKRNQHLLIIGLFIMCFFLLIANIIIAQKPPVVIRIDKLGHTDVVGNYVQDTESITDADLKGFSNVFLKNYVGLRSDLVIAQFEQSLNMMTPDFAKNHLETMKKNQTINTIKAANVRNDTMIRSVDFERAGDVIYVNVKGLLHTRPLDQINATPQSKSLIADLVLTCVDRTPEYPYGLLLKDIKLAIDKVNTEIDHNLSEVVND